MSRYCSVPSHYGQASLLRASTFNHRSRVVLQEESPSISSQWQIRENLGGKSFITDIRTPKKAPLQHWESEISPKLAAPNQQFRGRPKMQKQGRNDYNVGFSWGNRTHQNPKLHCTVLCMYVCMCRCICICTGHPSPDDAKMFCNNCLRNPCKSDIFASNKYVKFAALFCISILLVFLSGDSRSLKKSE